jgi:hypothetical protein
MDDDVSASMNRAMFLAPSLIDEGELDPLLAQALRNVDDAAAEAAAAMEARKATKVAPPPPPPKSFHPESTPEFRASLTDLVRFVGRRFVALIGGAAHTGAVHEWMIGESMPSHEYAGRLRLAARILDTLRKRLDDEAVAHWFTMKNDGLDGQMPIALLCLHPTAQVEERLRKAASL